MKKVLSLAMVAGLLFVGSSSIAQEKTKPVSPAMSVTQTIKSGATITINYGQPSVRGRKIGKDLEPKVGQVWRAGANDATVFETSKDVKVDGQPLPAGKYSFFVISGDEEWTLIFNRTWKQWGAYDYKQADDAVRITVKPGKAKPFAEKLTYDISKDGKVVMEWGDYSIDFKVK